MGSGVEVEIDVGVGGWTELLVGVALLGWFVAGLSWSMLGISDVSVLFPRVGGRRIRQSSPPWLHRAVPGQLEFCETV